MVRRLLSHPKRQFFSPGIIGIHFTFIMKIPGDTLLTKMSVELASTEQIFTETSRLVPQTTMEKDCHNRSVDIYIKVKKGNVLLYGLVKVSAIPFWSHADQFYRYIGVHFTFGLLDCDRNMGDIVIPWIVKRTFCFIHYTVTLIGLKNVNRYIGNIVLYKIVISGFGICFEF